MLPSKEIEDFASRGLEALLAKYDLSSKAKMRIRPLDALLATMVETFGPFNIPAENVAVLTFIFIGIIIIPVLGKEREP